MPAVLVFAGGEGVADDIEGLSFWTSILLIAVYVCGLVFALHTHKDIFNPVGGKEKPEWSSNFALGLLLLTTAMVADVIHVMDRGRIIESGVHDDLLLKNGPYAASWQTQAVQNWTQEGVRKTYIVQSKYTYS